MVASNGVASGELAVTNLALWTPEHPVLNAVEIATPSEVLKDRVGFRTIATSGPDIRLNGRKVFLRGICIH